MNAAALFVQPAQKSYAGPAGATSGRARQSEQFYDHPKLSAIMSHLQYEYSNYKYTVYRCAAKFVTLQKVFYTANIPYKLVLAVLARHGIRDAEANLMVPPFQLTALIHDVYFACEQLGHFTNAVAYRLESATAVLANFFWNTFDPHRRHSISLLEIKITFLLLCKLYACDQLVAEFHYLVSDSKSKCVSKFNFLYLLNIITKILTYIGEGSSYGAHNTQMVMEQCFARCHNIMGLTEYQFHCLWSTTQTRFLIYANVIALMRRMEDTEKLIHNNICASCRSERIVGLRFKCQTCKNLSLCLKCFATGYSTNKHEPGHRMYEVFTEDPPPKTLCHYFSKLCNMFFLAKSGDSNEETRGFCNSNEAGTANETELITIATHGSSPSSSSPDSSTNSSAAANEASVHHELAKPELVPQQCVDVETLSKLEPSLAGLSTTASTALNVSERLQSIIDRLLQQNAKLEQQLKRVQTASHEEITAFLSAHQAFLIDIITEMRNFSQSSSSEGSFPNSSTPNRTSIFVKKPMTSNSFCAVGSSNLTHSINGADINRSYLDANKSDYSISDLSSWFNQNRMSLPTNTTQRQQLGVLNEVTNTPRALDGCVVAHVVEVCDTEMSNFRLLLNKVKEIVEDSYSDNTELAEATQNLENVLDGIIQSEEGRRRSSM